MKKDKLILIIIGIAFIISLMILFSGCAVKQIQSLVRPFIVTDVYSVYREEQMSRYVFKDASGRLQHTYGDSNILNPKDTIHEKDLISYPAYHNEYNRIYSTKLRRK